MYCVSVVSKESEQNALQNAESTVARVFTRLIFNVNFIVDGNLASETDA